jgi:type III secretory pathway component EscU
MLFLDLLRHLYIYYIISFCSVALVPGCNWPCRAVVKHMNKWIVYIIIIIIIIVSMLLFLFDRSEHILLQ